MVWSVWNHRPSSDLACGLDINSGWVQAASGRAGTLAQPLRLTDTEEVMHLAIDLSGRQPQVGAAALAHRRRSPHLLCAGFLPQIGHDRSWSHGRHRLDAAAAWSHAAFALSKLLNHCNAVYATVPTYLAAPQVQVIRNGMESAKLPLAGSTILPLAMAAIQDMKRGMALVLDADDHSVSWSLISMDANLVTLVASTNVPHHGIRGWVDRLLDYSSDRCIRVSRRDPRDSAQAEHAIDQQLTDHILSSRHTRPLKVEMRTEQWFQSLTLSPEEIDRACSSLARTVAQAVLPCLTEATSPPEVLWVTALASRLPGLAGAVARVLPERTRVETIGPRAPAEAALALAVRRVHGDLPAGHLDTALPRPRAAAASERVPMRK